MIHLFNYISNFTVNGQKSTKILIFDIDDTLIKSDTKVYVVKDGKVVKTLSSSEYNDYKLQPGESFDYSEFNSLEVLNKSTFTKYWDTLKREYNNGTHISILTARADQNMIYKFFLKHGIDIKKELIFCINEPNYPFKGPIEVRKANTIKLLVRAGYKTLIFFDDNEDNLNAVKQLKLGDITIHTVKV